MLQLPSFRPPQINLATVTIAFLSGALLILTAVWLATPSTPHTPHTPDTPTTDTPPTPLPSLPQDTTPDDIADLEQRLESRIESRLESHIETRIETLRSEWQDYAASASTSPSAPSEVSFVTLALTLTDQIDSRLNSGRPFIRAHRLLEQMSSLFGDSWREALMPLAAVAESPLPSPSALLALIEHLPLPTAPVGPSAEERPSLGRFLASLVSIEKVDPDALTTTRHPLVAAIANAHWQKANALLQALNSPEEGWVALRDHVAHYITANRHLSVLRDTLYREIDKTLATQIEATP